ncbi:MAG: hypothetical protein HY363_04695 [Candidatus Aenigmarchaeota archaeon]|nr:hypothetical protein [Candidatus Aenigmarchaeota archaeon]
MKTALKESRIKHDFKLAEEILDLRLMKTNVVLEQLEENIRLREMPVEKQFSKKRVL